VLKKKGREFRGDLAPSTTTNRASDEVSPAKQFYYCFLLWRRWQRHQFLMEHQSPLSFSGWCWSWPANTSCRSNPFDGPAGGACAAALPIARPCCVPSPWPPVVFASQLRAPPAPQPRLPKSTNAASRKHPRESFRDRLRPRFAGETAARHLTQVEGLSPELLEGRPLVVSRQGGEAAFYDQRFRIG